MLKKLDNHVLVIESEQLLMLFRDREIGSRCDFDSDVSIENHVKNVYANVFDCLNPVHWEKLDFSYFEELKNVYEKITGYYFFEQYNLTEGKLPLKSYKIKSHSSNVESNQNMRYEVKEILNLTDLKNPTIEFILKYIKHGQNKYDKHEQKYAFKSFADLNELAKALKSQRKNNYMFEEILFNEFMFKENTFYEIIMDGNKRKIKLKENLEDDCLYNPNTGTYDYYPIKTY